MSTTSLQAGCDACNKSSLSLLLVRPSPIATESQLAPLGSSSVVSADGLITGLVPARKPTESRYVLRLLRAGYVHVYLPSPPPGMKDWLTYRVSDAADLIAQNNPVFNQVPEPQACSSKVHNKAGMKLLNIPQAHKVGTVWIAYSANLWSDKLKAQNAANPKAMQQVNLQGGAAHTFKPTVEALKTQVLECAVGSIRAQMGQKSPSALGQDFAFTDMVGQTQSLVDNLKSAAACHPKTQGLEVVVVLPDPVGVATELNALRLRRNQLLELEIAKPENSHPLNSDAALSGLKQVFLDSNLLNSYEKVSPLCTKAKFDSTTWPASTEWVPLTFEDRMHLDRLSLGDNFLAYLMLAPVRTVLESPGLGRAIYSDLEQRAATWAQAQVDKSWAALAPHIDDAGRTKWKAQFAARMKTLHHDPLRRYEQDWLSSTDAQETLNYFKLHFDPQDPNKPNPVPCAGEVYASESGKIHQPAPFSAELQEPYLQQMDHPIVSDKAVALRALVGNQESVFSLIHTQLSGDPGDTGMRDKTYDFLKGVLGLDAAKPGLKKYGWLGFGVAGFATGQLSALTGALTNYAMGRSKGLSPQMQARLLKVQALWGVQRTMEVAAAGALKGAAPAMPLLLYMQVDAQRALEVLRAHKGHATGGSNSYIKRLKKQGNKISLAVLTDTAAVHAVKGDIGAMAADPAKGKLSMGPSAKEASAGLGTLALTESEFLRLYAKESSLGTQAVSALRESLRSGGALQAKTIGLTLPGRLALGSMLVQGLGLINGLYALKQAGSDKEVRDAWYGIYDSTAGTLGGLLEMWSVAREASMMVVAGEEAAKKSLSIGALRFLGGIAGAAGGAVNAVGNWAKKADAEATGDFRVADLYYGSSLAFGGTIFSSGAIAVGAAADTLVARGVGGAVVEAIAARVGAGAVLATVGGTALTVSGVGLLLLGAGMALQVGAVALTPTPLQRWMSQSYFGKDPSMLSWSSKRNDMFAKGDWKTEFKGLQAALVEGGKVPTPESAKPSLGEKTKQAVSL
jgi:hypothetical protein